MMKFKDYISPNEDEMNYRVFFPEEYTDLPLIVFLHGAGERGRQIDHVMRHGIPRLIAEGREIPAVVLCPQCPARFVWDNIVKDLMALIVRIADEFEIKRDRIALTGASMGGFGTVMMGMTYPCFFSCIAPIAGGGMPWRSAKLIGMPVYMIHGTADETVPYISTEMVAERTREAGGDIRLLPLDGMGHNDGIDYAYRSTDVIDWLIKNRRCDFSYVKEICEDMF